MYYLILFEEYMLHDVAECHISKRGHCDIDFNFQGQIIVISGMVHNRFV